MPLPGAAFLSGGESSPLPSSPFSNSQRGTRPFPFETLSIWELGVFFTVRKTPIDRFGAVVGSPCPISDNCFSIHPFCSSLLDLDKFALFLILTKGSLARARTFFLLLACGERAEFFEPYLS